MVLVLDVGHPPGLLIPTFFPCMKAFDVQKLLHLEAHVSKLVVLATTRLEKPLKGVGSFPSHFVLATCRNRQLKTDPRSL